MSPPTDPRSLHAKVQEMRDEAIDIVLAALPHARAVLNPHAKVKWDPQQTRLFLGLLDKTMPTLKQIRTDPGDARRLDELSDEDLAAIAAQGEIDRRRASARKAASKVQVVPAPSRPAPTVPPAEDAETVDPDDESAPPAPRSHHDHSLAAAFEPMSEEARPDRASRTEAAMLDLDDEF